MVRTFWRRLPLICLQASAALLTVHVHIAANATSLPVCAEIFPIRPHSLHEDSRKQVETNNFTTSRDLGNYCDELGPDRGEPDSSYPRFLDTLRSLPNRSVWVDMGAGFGYALAEGLEKFANIGAGIGISYKRPGQLSPDILTAGQARMSYLEGAFVEDMYENGSLRHLKGKVRLITDVFGPLSYTTDPGRMLQIYLDLLTVGGEIDFNMWETESVRANTIITSDGESYEILPWLETIHGITVQHHVSGSGVNHYRIVKTDSRAKVVVPLKLLKLVPRKPPLREYWMGPFSSSSERLRR